MAKTDCGKRNNIDQLTLNQRVQGSKSLCAHHIKSLK